MASQTFHRRSAIDANGPVAYDFLLVLVAGGARRGLVGAGQAEIESVMVKINISPGRQPVAGRAIPRATLRTAELAAMRVRIGVTPGTVHVCLRKYGHAPGCRSFEPPGRLVAFHAFHAPGHKLMDPSEAGPCAIMVEGQRRIRLLRDVAGPAGQIAAPAQFMRVPVAGIAVAGLQEFLIFGLRGEIQIRGFPEGDLQDLGKIRNVIGIFQKKRVAFLACNFRVRSI